MFDNKSDNRDGAVEAVRVKVRVRVRMWRPKVITSSPTSIGGDGLGSLAAGEELIQAVHRLWVGVSLMCAHELPGLVGGGAGEACYRRHGHRAPREC